jgi:2-polyprenyl-3-methyl-5-hydroxy-6-metoxy-1,4-benzoquinol methylase
MAAASEAKAYFREDRLKTCTAAISASDNDHGYLHMTFQPAGNYYDKYHTRNPVARALMSGFLGAFDSLLSQCQEIENALEVGCGEGELTIRIASRCSRVAAFDIAPEAIAEARRRLDAAHVQANLRTDSIYDLDPVADRADLVVCCEVMEHLEDSQLALDKLHAVCRKYLITSVPREPLWRALNLARGKYIGAGGNTPGHVQHWSRTGFLALLQTRFRVVQARSPLPWTMALCTPLPDSRETR